MIERTRDYKSHKQKSLQTMTYTEGNGDITTSHDWARERRKLAERRDLMEGILLRVIVFLCLYLR